MSHKIEKIWKFKVSKNKKSENLMSHKIEKVWKFNPQALVAQKIADEVVFRRFWGEGVEFFKIGPHSKSGPTKNTLG